MSILYMQSQRASSVLEAEKFEWLQGMLSRAGV
jgi:hypothetical protein